MFENLVSVPLREVHIQQEKVWTGEVGIPIQSCDEGDDFLAVGDDAEVTMDGVLVQRPAHQSDIRGVVLG